MMLTGHQKIDPANAIISYL